MKKVKLFEAFINEASVTLKPVGRDTGVKLNIKSIKKQLEKDGYVVRYDNDSSMVNPKGINVFNPDSGHTLTIRRNGELFGDDNWGIEVKSEKEAIKALDQYEKELSESVNEGAYKHMPELIELLSDIDAMEMNPEEFIDQMVQYYDLDADTARDLFDAYWSLGAKDRFHFGEKDWYKFLKKQGIN